MPMRVGLHKITNLLSFFMGREKSLILLVKSLCMRSLDGYFLLFFSNIWNKGEKQASNHQYYEKGSAWEMKKRFLRHQTAVGSFCGGNADIYCCWGDNGICCPDSL